jgi:hypothetical protein
MDIFTRIIEGRISTMSSHSADDFPYDEVRPEFHRESQVSFQTAQSMSALTSRSGARIERPTGPVNASPIGLVIPSGLPEQEVLAPGRIRSKYSSFGPTHPWKSDVMTLGDRPKESHPRSRPVPAYSVGLLNPTSESVAEFKSAEDIPSFVTVGAPELMVYRTRLPCSLHPLLSVIIGKSEQHVRLTRNGNWTTNLYSLTKQDVPVSDLPGGLALTQALTDYVVQSIQALYHEPFIASRGAAGGMAASGAVATRGPDVHMDKNQPHVLKYCQGHSGVTLHYDRCDVTACLMLSDASEYRGGGTYFPSLESDGGGGTTVFLDRGDLLLHPGKLVHAGRDITSGSRYLLVWFCHLRYPYVPQPRRPS